ncbi:MAG TPA: hypothetical protein VET48_13745 [Steroidobacteraceae bacterium]|nr:hypothetical protein [Steroidobacteraceae bacterium]
MIYFYSVGTTARSSPFAVRVQMRGGVLNEFFPNATASIARDDARIANKISAGVIDKNSPIVLDNYVLGKLEWPLVTLDASAKPPHTSSAIWNAPRDVRAATLTVGNEGEHYLFYRGVAHLEALLRTKHSKDRVQLGAPEHLPWLAASSYTLPHVWLVDVHQDGSIAFTELRQVTVAKNAPATALAELPLFIADRYSTAQAAALHSSMHGALVEAGLYDDEASAMLATWNASYFQTPGLRIFYIVPREWFDYFLPLEISAPHTLTRVLVGRIDLLSS